MAYGLGMPARKRPTPEDAATARRIVLDGLSRDADPSELVTDGVSAVGQQVAEREDPNGKLDPSVCAYQQINNILTLVNGTILTA
jgi:hypothetical protein